jgi:hypothetical protein
MIEHLRTLKGQRRIIMCIAAANAVMIWSAPVPLAKLTHLLTIFILALLYAANERIHTLDERGVKGSVLPLLKGTLELSCVALLYVAAAASASYYMGQ